jgi:cytochrome c oxidase cbb3-type subunit III
MSVLPVRLLLLLASLAACSGGDRAASNTSPDSAGAVVATESTAAAPAAGGVVDTGASSLGSPPVIAHPENIQPGLAAGRTLTHLADPREGDPRALEEGKQLFVSYNCADCHGSEGSGAVGPSLQDGRWHFGGSAGEVFESIAEGRPNGMPAWGGRISDAQIWALVTYVRTLAAGKNVTTENFEGATVPRGGH